MLKDVYGNDVAILGINEARLIYREGQSNILYLILSTTSSCVLISLATILIIERGVLHPLSKFSEEVNKISESKDISQRLKITGDDELAESAKAVNTMLN
jgi:methyl-accepting chemotaxis protein